MAQSKRDTFDIESKLILILSAVKNNKTGPNASGQPFQTSYQLAIAFAERHPDVYQAIEFPIGGKGIGQRKSLAQYLAGELTKRINVGQVTRIDAAFVSKNYWASQTRASVGCSYSYPGSRSRSGLKPAAGIWSMSSASGCPPTVPETAGLSANVNTARQHVYLGRQRAQPGEVLHVRQNARPADAVEAARVGWPAGGHVSSV